MRPGFWPGTSGCSSTASCSSPTAARNSTWFTVAIANNSIHGLAGEVSAGDVDRALEVAKRMRTGKVTINGRSHFGITSPFGGTKQSGLGYRNGGFATIPMSTHYITNIESDIRGDTARVRAMFYNPMQLPGMAELSYCGGYYHHEVVRTLDGWRSRMLREENAWFVNHPAGSVSGG